MKRVSFRSLLKHAASLGALAALLACGGISDPTKTSGNAATVSGALMGADVPAGARVALVWRAVRSGSLAVAGDTAIENGTYTMAFAPPPDDYFFRPGDTLLHASAGAPADDAPESAPGLEGKSAPFAFATGLAPRDAVGGTVGQPFTAAVAGFVVYLDTNGNGKLDLSGSEAASGDVLIGGHPDLMLTYLRDGTTSDYEELRGPSGPAPTPGFNLFWPGRWSSLEPVNLTLIQSMKLPSNVCAGLSAEPMIQHDGSSGPVVGAEKYGPGDGNYPAADDPDLHCTSDGRAFVYTPTKCDNVGLCCSNERRVHNLDLGVSPPAGWPCTVRDPSGQ